MSNMAIVSSYFNPCKFRRLRENCQRFIDGLGEHASRLYLATLRLDDDPEEIHFHPARTVRFQGVRPDHCLFQKEALLNAAIRRVPAQYDAIAWVDADLIYDDPGWVEAAEKELDRTPVIQPFGSCAHLTSSGQVGHVRYCVASEKQPKEWGMAWAARREAIPDGLLDWLVTGSGDGFMAAAWLDSALSFWGAPRHQFGSLIPGFGCDKWDVCSIHMRHEYQKWKDKNGSMANGKVGGTEYSMRHLFHGTLANRRYQYRSDILKKLEFDPVNDLIREDGLLRWKSPNSEVAKAVRAWFASRKEDEDADTA